jgi:hypothetical protein
MAKGRKTGGRAKGTPNKVTGDLRSMVEGALSDVGGRQYLAEQARENPTAFIGLLGKCMPRDVNVGVTQSLADLIREATQPKAS